MNAGRFALTGVAVATACLWGTPSWALGLGRINVQSGLGEALRAEIEVTSITPEESASLRLRVASPEAYRAAGIEYNAALGGAHAAFQPRGAQQLRRAGLQQRALLEHCGGAALQIGGGCRRTDLHQHATGWFATQWQRPPATTFAATGLHGVTGQRPMCPFGVGPDSRSAGRAAQVTGRLR